MVLLQVGKRLCKHAELVAAGYAPRLRRSAYGDDRGRGKAWALEHHVEI